MSHEQYDRSAATSRYSDWSAYRLDEIWQMLRDENGRTGWIQDAAWRRLAALCDDQADQLERAVAQLTERWPARPGTASFAFKARVDGLIASMRDSVRAAVANQDAIQRITYALSTARAEVAALLDEAQRYAGAEQQMIEYTRSLAGWYPSKDTLAPAPAEPARPPDNWKANLDQRARDIIAQADTMVGAQIPQITVPRKYDLDPRITAGRENLEISGANFGAYGSGLPMVPLASQTVYQPLPPDAWPSAVTVTGPADGPVLAGDSTHSGPVAGPSGGVKDLSINGPNPVVVAAPSSGVLWPGRVATAGRSSGTVTPRGQAPGGSPGGHAPAAGVAAGRPRAAGMLGMPMAPMAPPAGARATGTPAVAPGGRPALSGSQRRRTVLDPDDPWAVRDGGPGVLEPPAAVDDHDPGPGVIGLGR